MSIATAKQFLQKVQVDQAVQAKLQTVANGKSEGMLAEVTRMAAADGFVFTAGEFESALKEQLTQPMPIEGELSVEDLELVAGGKQNSDLEARKEKTDGGFWGAIIGNLFGNIS